MGDNCILCLVKNEQLEVSKVYEDNMVTAVMDIQPVNPGHILVFPNECKQYISELSDETVMHMFKVAKKINIAIRKSNIKCEGVNYFLADGEAAMQEIPHCHLHIFPRFENDGFDLKFSEDYTNLPSRAELDKIALTIKNQL